MIHRPKHKPVFLTALFLSLFFGSYAPAQALHCTPEDRQLVEAKILEIAPYSALGTGAAMVAIGKTFLETPYVAKTLEIGPEEGLVINMQGLDCTTFVENVLALALLLPKDARDFTDFTQNLTTIRYAGGNLQGYGSRLHYFTEWIRDNERKGLVNDMASELGGVPLEKDIDFMGSHRELYPFLEDDANYGRILETEKALKAATICYLPQSEIAAKEHQLQDGDIIALATNIKGLDVTHTGLALKAADGRIHLLHASTGSMQVEITEKPLAEYLKGISNNIGILVARPVDAR